jgi:hypothetical protein
VRSTLTSVLVDDQDKALRLYTEVLGFVKRPRSRWGHSWLTVVSPGGPQRDRAGARKPPRTAEQRTHLSQDAAPTWCAVVSVQVTGPMATTT